MSESTKATSKPKRPLSGYNLFYRYKRNRILEATSRPNGNDNDREARAVIHAVLAAVPGLEGVPSDSPAFHLPPAQLNEFRAATIRSAMEGKIFPNENARKRVHSKFLGMGFVEMGRTMRDMWAQADKFTKDLFCDLADVGRVRYRRLMADFNENKLGREPPENSKSKVANEANKSVVPVPVVHEYKTTAAAVDPLKNAAMAKAGAVVPSFVPHQAPSASDPMLEALSAVWSTRNPPPAPSSSHPTSSHPALEARRDRWGSLLTDLQRRCDGPDGEGPTGRGEGPRPILGASADHFRDLRFQAPRNHQARSFGGAGGDWDWRAPPSFDAATSPPALAAPETNAVGRPSRGRRVSAVASEIDLCDVSLFEPLPVERAEGPVAASAFQPAPAEASQQSAASKTGYGQGRRVSTDVSALPLRGVGGVANAATAVATGNGGAGPDFANANQKGLKKSLEAQQMLLRNAIQNIKDKIIQNNSLLPSDMRVFPKEDVVSQGHAVGGKQYLEITTPSAPPAPSSNEAARNNGPAGGDGREKGAVSAQDFMAFIGELDEAIDEPEDSAAGVVDGARGSFVFDKPVFGMPGPNPGVKSTPRTTVPMPAGIRLRNDWARMA